MKQDQAAVLDSISHYFNVAGDFFEPRTFTFSKPILPNCPHCGKKQKTSSVCLYPNVSMMGYGPLPQDSVSIIATCPQCGNRIALSYQQLRKMLKERGRTVRRAVVLGVLAAAAVAAVAFTTVSTRSADLLAEGRAALAGGNYETAVDKLQSARDWGSADAVYLLSECYRAGNGVPANEQTADELLQEALDKKSGMATYSQAMAQYDAYLAGGAQEDLTAAMEWLNASTAPDAKYQLSLFARAGIGRAASNSEADTLLEEAANAGSIPALCDVTQQLVYNGQASDALEMLEQYPDQENADIIAARGYANLFIEGNSAVATQLLSQASDSGSSWANYYWGEIYYNSMLTGGDRDLASAIQYYQLSSDAGNYRGRVALALSLSVQGGNDEQALALAQDCYDHGYIVAGCTLRLPTTDSTPQLEYANQAAARQYAPAEIWLGSYYSSSDPELSETYLRNAYGDGARREANQSMNWYFEVGEDYFGRSNYT